MENKGIFVISLDFELMWGMHDCSNIDTYGENIIGARKAIPEILRLFSEYNIHATWGTVGMLFAGDRDTLLSYFPARKPDYLNKKLSVYNYMDMVGKNEEEDPYHYGKKLIKEIRSFPDQEIASHTFSHYYCREKGQDIKDFSDDLFSAVRIARDEGITIKSLIFPRNQVNRSYIEEMERQGIISYRGEDQCYIYRGENLLWKRVLRFLDVYLGFVRTHCYQENEIGRSGVLDIRASMFLRPYMKRLRILEPIKIFHIKRDMRNAAKKGEVFHLWFHPHNMGKNMEENLANLREILQYYSILESMYQFKSLNMGELAQLRLNIKEGNE